MKLVDVCWLAGKGRFPIFNVNPIHCRPATSDVAVQLVTWQQFRSMWIEKERHVVNTW